MNDSISASAKRKFTQRLKEARIGDPAAQYDIALMYATGVGVGKNVAQAFAWTKTAAEKGYTAAQYLLGSAYSGGLGTPKDEQKALAWFVKAYEHGHDKAALKLAKVLGSEQTALAFQFAQEAAHSGLADAQLTVADCYAQADGVDQDDQQARLWYQRAAEQGLAAAQFALGNVYAQARGAQADTELAHQWYRAAAAQGHPGAQLALDRMDAEGLGRNSNKTKNRPAARERRSSDSRWIKYAAHGRRDDFFDLGVMYDLGVSIEKNSKQAKVWYRKAADLGHANAQFALAQSLDPLERDQAARWYRLAAAQGHAQAQLALGNMQLDGVGIDQDKSSALAWFAQAAEQGVAQAQHAVGKLLTQDASVIASLMVERAAAGGQADAQFAMGDRYRQGVGVAQNWFEAARWYQLSADQGHAAAQCSLAGCYAQGLGVKKDIAIAFHWYEMSAAQNFPQAQWNLGELYATGLPGVEPDAKKATSLCKRAANAGFAPASATLASLFVKAGKHERAVPWWVLAAEQGDLEAYFNLGQAYRLGLGVARDEDKAFDMLLKAAAGGLAVAQSRIGLAYATGEGAALDPIEACKWFELAALKGDKAAAANRVRARKALSMAQQTEVDRRIKEWLGAAKKET